MEEIFRVKFEKPGLENRKEGKEYPGDKPAVKAAEYIATELIDDYDIPEVPDKSQTLGITKSVIPTEVLPQTEDQIPTQMLPKTEDQIVTVMLPKEKDQVPTEVLPKEEKSDITEVLDKTEVLGNKHI